MGRYKSLDCLKSIPDKTKILVRVPAEGKQSIDLLCEIECDEDLRIGVEVRPDYSVEGIFIDGHDKPKIGQEIREIVFNKLHLSLSGYKNRLLYGRIHETIPKSVDEFKKLVNEFAEDVSKAVPQVDGMVQIHLSNKQPEDVKYLMQKYLPQGAQ